MRDQQVAQLKSDLDKAKEARRHALDECSSLKVQLEQHVEAAAVLAAEQAVGCGSSGSGDGKGLNLEDAYLVETVPMLKEKVKKLERELRMLRDGGSSGNNSGNDGDNQLIQQQLLVYGHHLGLIFQIKDDILDVEQSTETLGKTSKSDQKSQKATFVSLLGLNGAKQQLDEHYNLAILALQNLSGYNNKKIKLLQRFADYFKTRNF